MAGLVPAISFFFMNRDEAPSCQPLGARPGRRVDDPQVRNRRFGLAFEGPERLDLARLTRTSVNPALFLSLQTSIVPDFFGVL
jgi:hypothetical protein